MNNHLNRNNIVSNQFIRNQFSIIPLNLVIHTFPPESLRKTGSHPEPREHIFVTVPPLIALQPALQ